MGKIKLRHYAVRKGRGYWLVTPKMREHGFENVRCGTDGPDAWRVAEEWEARWQAARRGVVPSQRKVYPRGSIGDGFERYRHTGAWAAKKPRSREDWDRGWKYIEPFFADQRPASITFEMLDKWYFAIKAKKGTGEADSAMKTWRALYNVLADMKLCSKGQDPSLSIRRKSVAGRTQAWTEGEVVRLAKQAWRTGYRGLACVIAVAWDTGFSPVDVRTLSQANVVALGDSWGSKSSAPRPARLRLAP